MFVFFILMQQELGSSCASSCCSTKYPSSRLRLSQAYLIATVDNAMFGLGPIHHITGMDFKLQPFAQDNSQEFHFLIWCNRLLLQGNTSDISSISAKFLFLLKWVNPSLLSNFISVYIDSGHLHTFLNALKLDRLIDNHFIVLTLNGY